MEKEIFYVYACAELLKTEYNEKLEVQFDQTESLKLGSNINSETHLLCKAGSNNYKLHTRTVRTEGKKTYYHYVFELVCERNIKL